MVIAAAARVSCSHGRLAAARVNKKGALSFLIKLLYDLSGNRTRVYAVRGRRLDRLTIRPWSRGDKIRTCDLCVPNAALYQTEPRLDVVLCISELINNTTGFQKKQEENTKNFKKFNKNLKGEMWIQ